MKNKLFSRNPQIKFEKLLCMLFALVLLTMLSCSTEEFDSSPIQEAKLTFQKNGDITWDMEVELLTKKMRRFYNFEVATAQGWDTDVTGYVPHMGHHYMNASLLDDTFELLSPEVLLYVPDANGNMRFLGVEYLVPMDSLEDPSTPPEGFTGNEDEWMIVGPFWTLHAWVGLENPDGVFAPFNPLVD